MLVMPAKAGIHFFFVSVQKVHAFAISIKKRFFAYFLMLMASFNASK